MTRVLLTRHGHVEGIHPPRFRGRHDVPLSPIGRTQADAVAAAIAASGPIRAVYTSPMSRCVDTGQRIADACNTPCTSWSSLSDLDYGIWQWKTHEDMRQAAPDLFAQWFSHPERVQFPEGESLQDLIARTAMAIRKLYADHADDTVVVVGHDSVNRAIMMQILDQPLSAYWRLWFSPCAISEFEIAHEKMQVVRINDASHLPS